MRPSKKPSTNARAFRATSWIGLVTVTVLAAVVAWQASQTEGGLLHSRAVDQRQLDPQRFLKALEGRPKAPVQIVVAADDSEALQLARQFQSLLQIATWKVSNLVEVNQRDLVRLANLPTYGSEVDKLVGIAIAVVAESQEEFDVFGDREANTPLNALLEAILETLGSVNTYAASKDAFPAPPPQTLRIAVGSRPTRSVRDH